MVNLSFLHILLNLTYHLKSSVTMLEHCTGNHKSDLEQRIMGHLGSVCTALTFILTGPPND